MKAQEYAPGVMFAPTLWGDKYVGTIEAVIEAGLVLPHQLPGAPGNGKTMVSFRSDGRLVGKGYSRACYQPGYLKVCKAGLGRVRVVKGIGLDAEYARRKARREQSERDEAEALALQRCWPFPIVCGEPV